MRTALRLPSSPSAPLPAAPRERSSPRFHSQQRVEGERRGRRFVQDGEVPVVVITPRHPRAEQERAAVTELEHALAVEREARQAAEKALQRAEATIRQLHVAARNDGRPDAQSRAVFGAD